MASGSPAERVPGTINMALLNEINPAFPVEFIEIFKKLAAINPDVSQAVQKITMLGNNGHYLDMTASSEYLAGTAVETINKLAKNGFGSAAGLDGFINKMIRQVMISGALSQESCIENSFSGIKEIYQVKVSTIRFKYIDGTYCPYQRTGAKEIMLNPVLYSYIPLLSDEDSPYGIPPMLAALKMLYRQESQWDSIDEYTSLWGILGMTHIKTDAPREMGERDKEYVSRARKYFKDIYDDFVKGVKKGIAVTNKSTEIAHHNISQSTGNMGNLIQALEQQIASGIDIDPAMLGRTYSTTETYATVCYETLLGKIENIRRIIKRSIEHYYSLHLLLSNIPADCSVVFNAAPSLKEKEKIEAEKIRQDMVLARLQNKIIDADTAAKELGYEKAADTLQEKDDDSNSLSLKLKFDKTGNKYIFEKERIILSKKKLKTTL